jgi:hypothetical protein
MEPPVLEKVRDGSTVSWKLAFDAERDALLYVNGKFVGRYSTKGPQSDFCSSPISSLAIKGILSRFAWLIPPMQAALEIFASSLTRNSQFPARGLNLNGDPQ